MIELDATVDVSTGTLPDVLRDNAARDPDAVAVSHLTFPAGAADTDGRGRPRRLTRGRYHQRSSAVAAELATLARPGDRVLVLLPPGPELLVALTAALYAGAVATTCPPPPAEADDPRTERVRHIIRRAGVRAVVTTAEVRDRLGALCAGLHAPAWVALDEVADHAADAFRPPTLHGDDLALLQFSPGPTGADRGVMVSHANLLAQLDQTARLAGLPPATTVVGWASPYHALGLAGHLLLAQYLGGRAVSLAPEDFVADPLRWLRAISDEPGPVFGCAPNFAFDRCVDRIDPARRTGLDLSGWHTTFNAAEQVRPRTVARFVDAFGRYGFRAETMAPAYGLSETMLFVTGRRLGDGPAHLTVDAHHLAEGRAVPAADGVELVPLGGPGPHVELLVVDPDTREPVADGRVGEVWVRGPVVCQGYWDRPELTARTFGVRPADGTRRYLRTGDLGFRHDGQLVLCGRCKDLVIIRGRNLFPQDVEATCRDVLGDAAAPVAAFSTDGGDGERLVVVAGVADPDRTDLPAVARRLRAAVTGAHEVDLDELVLVGAGRVPRAADGSVDRRGCRHRHHAGELTSLVADERPAADDPADLAGLRGMLRALDAPLRAPVLLAELRRRLAVALGSTVEQVAPDVPLAGLGVESLRAIELRRDLERELGAAVPVTEFLRGSLSGLADLVAGQIDENDTERADIAWRPLVADPEHRHDPFPLTEQQHAYLVGRGTGFDLGGVSVHLYVEIDGVGLDLDRLTAALDRLVVRHEMLRAVIDADGRQRILPPERATPVRVAHADLSDADQSRRAAHLDAVRGELSHQVLPLGRPMFEIRTTGLPDAVTRVHVSIDLLVADVASIRLFFLEWGDLYRDLGAHPEPPAVSFRDYVLALDQVRSAPAYRRSRDYWLARIADLPPGPALPTVDGADRNGRRRRSYLLDAARWARLRARAADRGLTPSAVQLAAFAEVLGRWSRTGRFTINVPLFNRMPLHPDIDDVIGDFTAVTLLEVDVGPRDGVGGLADRVQAQLWRDLEHRYFSGVEVMRELSRRRGIAPGTFAGVVFASAREQGRDRQGGEGALGSDWLGETAHVVSQTPQVSFDHQVYEDHGALSVNWDVVAGMIDDDVLDDMFDRYRVVLESLADDDDAWRAGAFDALPDRQARLLRGARPADVPVPDELLHTAFLRRAAERADHPAVVAADATLGYAALHRHAAALAHTLRAAGVRPGSLVAVAMDKSAAQVAAVLGVELAGGAYLPIDPELPEARQDHLLRHGGAEVVLTRAGGPDRAEWPPTVRRVVVDVTVECEDVPVPQAAQRPDDVAYVLYTSGSTGTPKGVALSHRAVLNTVLAVDQRWQVGADDVAFGLSSLSFDLSVWDVFGVLGTGGTLVLPESSAGRDPGRWLDLMAEHGVTVWNSVPALAQMLVEHAEPDGGHPGLARLRLMWLSGDWIPVTFPDRLRALAPACRVVSLGGATEAAIWSVAYDVERVDPAWDSVPYGRALPGQSLHVLNDRWQRCPVGVTGELFIGGAGLADGYWRDPERTAASFVTHPVTGERLYRTGDLGRWSPDGVVEFLGREDGQVKVGGYRIELGEVESVLTRHPAVRQAAVVATGPDHARTGLAAFVVPESSRAPGDEPVGTEPAGTGMDAETADKLLLGDVLTDPVRRAEFTLARPGLRRGLTGQPRSLPAALDDAEADRLWHRRASRRHFAADPVPLTALGALLECLRSRDTGALPKYRYGSAGAVYPVQTYLHVRPGGVADLAAGSYYYDPSAHRLLPVSDARLDRDVHVSTNHDAFDRSAFTIVLVGHVAAIEPLYGSQSERFCLLEAGQMSQLLAEAAPESELGLCSLGLLRDESAVRAALDLDERDLVLHAMLGGCHRSAGDGAPDGAPTGGPLTERLRAHAADNLPHYLVPATVRVLDGLPLTDRGKVDRAALQRLAGADGDGDRHGAAAYTAPGSPIERTVTEVVQRVLGIDRVGIDDRFFDLGADSVTLVRVYRQLCAALGRDFPLMHMFEHPTVRRLAAGLAGTGHTGDAVDAAFAAGGRRRARRRTGGTVEGATKERP